MGLVKAKTVAACVLRAPRDLRMEAREIPPPGPGQVRLRLLAGGVCGTDRHYFADGMSGPFRMSEPLILGHEAAAEVDESGPHAEEFHPGEMVAVNPARVCGRCEFCRDGRANLCPNVFFYGSASRLPHMQGLFREFFLADALQCVAVPAGSDAVRVSCAEPLAVALHAVRRGGEISGREILVTGCGPIGLLTILAARLAGAARIVATDPRESARNLAKQMGADDSHPAGPAFSESEFSKTKFSKPPSVAFECSGAPDGLRLCLRACARGGRIVMVGNLPPDSAPPNLSVAVPKELDLVGAFRFANEFPQAVELLVSGKANVSPMLSGAVPLAEAPRIFADFPPDAAKIHLVA